MRVNWRLFFVFLIVRVIFAVFQRTTFVPDEHWQSAEVAYRLVFGAPEKTWEWRDDIAIRAHIYPLVFAIFYKLLAITNLDYPWLIAYGPRFIQAFIAAIGDLSYYRLASLLFGREAGSLATSCHITSWMSVFSYTRTTSNATDVTLTLLGLWLSLVGSRGISVAAAVSFIMRPNSSIFWIPVCIQFAARSNLGLTIRCLLLGLSLIVFACSVDRIFYGSDTGWLVPWNFLRFNLVLGVAKQYGDDPWYKYIFMTLGNYLSYTPMVILGLFRLPRAWIIGAVATFIVLSLSAHKELRFLSPVLAVASIGIAPYLTKNRWFLLVSWVVHAAVGMYCSRWQGAGAELVMSRLRDVTRPGEKVMFLTHCHQTPYRSFLHASELQLDFLDCSPWPVRVTETSERDSFFADPARWVKEEGQSRVVDADWIVLDSLVELNQEFMRYLDEWKFQDAGPQIFNALFVEAPKDFRSSFVWGSTFRFLRKESR